MSAQDQPFSKPYTISLPRHGHIQGLTLFSSSSSSSSSHHKPQCHFFGSLPYALPPTGKNRFRKPRPLPRGYSYGTQERPGVFAIPTPQCPQPAFRGPPDTRAWDEDCLKLNVWVPLGEAPKSVFWSEEGWPVFFFIHGGWLQFGSPNAVDPRALLADTECKCIIVCPAYRLNVFGFLACRELETESDAVGNYGFWDQRLALEWTWENIAAFGGDRRNITVGGYSAGAHSAFHQLSHDLFAPHPTSYPPLIRRAAMFSNGPGPAPKHLPDAQPQLTQLLSHLRIPPTLPARETLRRLRSLPAHALVAASAAIPLHEFRALTDGAFVPADLFTQIESGEYGARMRARGVRLVMGECADERFVYGAWRPPDQKAGLAGLRRRLEADYAADIVGRVFEREYCAGGGLPRCQEGCGDWGEAFGAVYADMQVHGLQRGFVERLGGEVVRRYRVEWRARCCDAGFPREWGVTHGTDMAVWFWGNGMGGGLAEEEKGTARGFLEPFWRFLKGEEGWEEGWHTDGVKEVRRLRQDGSVECGLDEDWERAMGVWRTVMDVQKNRREDEIVPSKL